MSYTRDDASNGLVEEIAAVDIAGQADTALVEFARHWHASAVKIREGFDEDGYSIEN